jgi:ABC-type branched-subunit amino acid transport system ATPase component
VAAGLTESEVDEFIAPVRRIRDMGITVVWIEHVMRTMLTATDRLMALAGGRCWRWEACEVFEIRRSSMSTLVHESDPPVLYGCRAWRLTMVSCAPSMTFHWSCGVATCWRSSGPTARAKSTLLRSLVGLMGREGATSVRGAIEFEGKRIDHLRSDQIVDAGVTLVPEGRRLFARMTVQDNLMAGAYLARCRSTIAANSGRSTRCFRAWRSARPRWSPRCRAANNKWCPLAARSCPGRR